MPCWSSTRSSVRASSPVPRSSVCSAIPRVQDGISSMSSTCRTARSTEAPLLRPPEIRPRSGILVARRTRRSRSTTCSSRQHHEQRQRSQSTPVRCVVVCRTERRRRCLSPISPSPTSPRWTRMATRLASTTLLSWIATMPSSCSVTSAHLASYCRSVRWLCPRIRSRHWSRTSLASLGRLGRQPRSTCVEGSTMLSCRTLTKPS